MQVYLSPEEEAKVLEDIAKKRSGIDDSKKQDSLFSKWLVLAICTAVCVFTVFIFVAIFLDKMIPDSIVYAWFSFWGVELVNLMLVKRGKIAHQTKADNTQQG
jgi:hypothetical protein